MPESEKPTPFERFKIGVRAQIPIVRAMEKELGVEKAHALIRASLDDDGRAAAARRAQRIEVDVPLLLQDFTAAGDGITYHFEVVEQTAKALRTNVHACDYANYMEKIGARDLGPLLVCENDFALAEGLGVTLTRTKTCMKDDGVCDFCFEITA